MFGNVGNNNSNDRSINTKIKTFFGEISCLQITYWNENISLKINPLQGVTPDGLRQYDYNRRANTALTSEKCIALADKIKKNILPKIEEVQKTGILDKPINVGVSVGTKGSAIFIEYKNDENNTPYLYLTVYTNIGQDNKAPKDGIYSYKFAKINVIEDYNPDDGSGKDSFIDAEFLFFYDKIKNISDICGTAAHSVNMDSTFKSSNTKNNYSSFNSNNINSTSNNNNYSAPVSSFDSNTFSFDV